MKNQLKPKTEFATENRYHKAHAAGNCKCNGKCRVCKCMSELSGKKEKK